jgi:hypothetical protein
LHASKRLQERRRKEERDRRKRDYICNTCGQMPKDRILETQQPPTPPINSKFAPNIKDPVSESKPSSPVCYRAPRKEQGAAIVQHCERKKMEDMKRNREVIARGESPLSEEEVRHVTDFSAITGEEANISMMSLSKAEVEARKGDTLHVIKEIKDQITLMQEEVSKG